LEKNMNEITLTVTAHKNAYGDRTPYVTLKHCDYNISILGLDHLRNLISALDEARIHLENDPEFRRTVALR